MEYTFSLWIKAIAYLTVAVLIPLGSIFMVKKRIWKNYEFAFAVLVALFIAVLGIKSFVFAVNPKIEYADLQYQYSSSSGEIFGSTYYFADREGNDYELTMDPVTNRKILAGKELKKNSYYNVGYDKRTNTITSIQ